MPFFSKLKKSKGTDRNARPNVNGHAAPVQPQWSDAWLRTRVDPEEVTELLRGCTQELKSRALDLPFLLLPFRPTSDPSAARTFIRNYFFPQTDRETLRGDALARELRLTEPMVLASVLKWCWSRLPGGVVTWESYELFRVGERDSGFARDAFTTFLPISVDSDARVEIIRDFFDLMAAVAAHGKTNGLSGRKLSRFAGWWAFEHYDTGKGFDAGYRSWISAANATSHLFFAYLRSLSPDSARGANGILGLPISLQQLMESTEYPPEQSPGVINDTTKVVMIVDVVSPTPFALLRRAKNFEYRDDDVALQQFSNFDDPIQALTDECRRVLRCISSTNQSNVSNSKNSTSLLDPSWSRFEDVGFGSTIEESDEEDGSIMGRKKRSPGLSASPRSQTAEFGRPQTPSWADFLSSGFVDENGNKAPAPVLLPPDQMLPPIRGAARGHSSQSHRRQAETDSRLEPGELASIDRLDLDDSFWWVWISSLAGEEPTSRKAAFGRCALIETVVAGGKWMVMEEQVKGAAPEAAMGGYIAEKKGFFSTAKGRLTRRRSQAKKSPLSPQPYQRQDFDPASRVTILPDQHARIQAAAAELSRKKRLELAQEQETQAARTNRQSDHNKSKTNSIMSLQPFIMTEASPAMKWANQYDKQAIRAAYLGDNFAGRGSAELLTLPPNGIHANGSVSTFSTAARDRELPPPPPNEEPVARDISPAPAPEPRQVLHEAPPVQVSQAAPPTPTMAPPPPTMAPPPLPVEPVEAVQPEQAAEAAEVPLPPAYEEPAAEVVPEVSIEPASQRPVTPTRPHSRLRKKSIDTSPEQRRQKKKGQPKGPPPAKSKQPPSGFRQFFGARRDKPREEQAESSPLSPADPNPAVAAARAALEGRSRAQGGSRVPSEDTAHLSKMRTVNNTRPAPERPITPPASDHDDSVTPQVVENVSTARVEEPAVDQEGPRTRRDEEYDNLSRVDTNEREHADREFSQFDQGPLVEQPAFAPRDSYMPTPDPQPEVFSTPYEERPEHRMPNQFSVYGAVTAQESIEHNEDQAEDTEPGDLAKQVSPLDRWAQIRKNAAERAAKLAEEPVGRPSHTETRTDDGETSGEETIESRVARIKARVAELTGNMEATRR